MDSAVHILDYRLSHTTDYIVHTIYKYRISLLQNKIEKTHKKFATSVPAPVSVSSNKYTSLVVEDVDTQYTTDCADATASFVVSATVLSMGVPRSGSAPDVKRGVLNSCVLINGQKFPSLASSDSESPANDLEVGFPVELRRTITMEREVQIPVSHTKYVWYRGHRDHISCVLKTEELFQEHFYQLKAPGVEDEEPSPPSPPRPRTTVTTTSTTRRR